jgi:hypothetical protein
MGVPRIVPDRFAAVLWAGGATAGRRQAPD